MTHGEMITYRILIIDDTTAVREDFCKSLQDSPGDTSLLTDRAASFGDIPLDPTRAGFEVDCAAQGQTGLTMLQNALQCGRPYAVAFVDMIMPPGWDGVETIVQLWKVDPELQVVLCTAFSDLHWDDTMHRLGHSDQLLILRQPFEPIEVLQLARSLTQKWRLSQQARRQLAALEESAAQRTQALHTANACLQRDLLHHPQLESVPQRNVEALAARIRQIEAVHTVATEITRELHLPTLLQLILQRVVALIDTVGVGRIYLWDEASQMLVSQAQYGSQTQGRYIRLAEGLTGTVAQSRQGLSVDDYQHSPYALPDFVHRIGSRAMLAEPLLYQGRLVGVASVVRREPGSPFTTEERHLLALFAPQAAIAIEHARLFTESAQRQEHLAEILDINKRLATSENMQELFTRIAQEASRLVHADVARVRIRQGDRLVGFVVTGDAEHGSDGLWGPDMPSGEGLGARVLRENRVIVVPDIQADPDILPTYKARAAYAGLHSLVALPIPGYRAAAGLLTVLSKTPRVFTANEIAVLSACAEQAAIALVHVRLLNEARASETKFTTIFRMSPNPIIVTRLDDSRYVEVSDQFTALTGYAREDICGKTPLELNLWVHPEKRHRFQQDLQTHGEVRNLEVAARTKTGTLLTVLLSATLIEIDHQPHVLSLLQDISTQKRAEAALAAETRFLHAQTTLAAVAMMNLHAETLPSQLLAAVCQSQEYAYGLLWRVVEDGQVAVTVANYGDKTAPLLGYRLPLDESATFIAHVIRQKQPQFCNRVSESPYAASPLAQVLGYQALLAVPLIDRHGTVFGAIGVCDSTDPERFAMRDLHQGTILARQVAQAMEHGALFRQLQQLQARYQAVMDTLHDAVYMVDLDGHIVFTNPALTQLTQYSLEELLGQPSALLFTPDALPAVLERRRTLVPDEPGSPYQQRTIIRKDGQQANVEVSTVGLSIDGQVTGFVVVLRDLTARLQLESQLRQAQKMEAIGTLVGGIAHDFNNILSAVLGNAELLLDDLPRHSPARENGQQILIAGERARMLVEQLLTFSRQTEQARRPVQLALLVREALALLRAALPSTIALRQQLDTEASLVLADPTQMHQVLMNLCTNAAHAMRTNGGVLEVRIEAIALPPDGIVVSPNLAPGRYVRLTVHDTGHGIAPAILERIFEPFFTTKDVGEGTGLGLAVVHGIVTSHGGTITVESPAGQGTTFTMYLPQATGPVPSPNTTEEPMLGGRERILFVDDEAHLAHLGQMLLTRLGYEVTISTSSLEALALFRAAPERFDLLITDQTMPHMTGDLLAQIVRYIRPDLPIILCTGFSQTMTAEKAAQLGLDALCMKPLLGRQLNATIRRVLAQCGTGRKSSPM